METDPFETIPSPVKFDPRFSSSNSDQMRLKSDAVRSKSDAVRLKSEASDLVEYDLMEAFSNALDQNDQLFDLVQKQKAIIKELALLLKTVKRKLSG